MKGMILAAGYGTRFRPATYEIPKPIVPVCNRPLIAWLVDSLLVAGVREIIVNLHHLPAQIEDYLRGEYAGRCSFTFSFEPEILGTGGGVRKVRSVLASDDAFYLLNGDTIQQAPFDELLRSLKATKAVAALLLRRPPPDDRFTPVMLDGRFITGFGKGAGEPLMFAGAHAVSRKIFEYLPDRDFSGLTEDVYGPLTEQGSRKIAGLMHQGTPWFDIGTPRRYMTASREILKLVLANRLEVPPNSLAATGFNSLLGSDTECQGEVSGTVIGERCRISRASIHDSVLWNDVEVQGDVTIRDSIIAHNVHLPAGARVENALVCRALEGIRYEDPVRRVGEFAAASIDRHRPLELHLNGS